MSNFISDNLLQKTKKIIFCTCKENELMPNESSSFSKNISKTPIHITSQFLSDSSLAFDVNKLENMLARDIKIEVTESEYRVNSEKFRLISIEIPDDLVNNHIAMETFISLLYHLRYLGITKEKDIITEIPSWMKLIYDSFIHPESYIDIKYFISKLVLNCHKIFEHCAKFWIPELIVFLTMTQKSINPYVVSMVTLINQWSNRPDVINTVPIITINKLLKFIVENCYSENPTLTQINLKLFQILVKKWSPNIDIPYTLIFENLRNINNNNRTCCGLQMLAFVLKSDCQFMLGANTETKIGFIKLLAITFRNKSKAVYGIGFELSGIILKQSSNGTSCTDPWIIELKREMNTSLDLVCKRNTSDYVTCLALISLNSSDFIYSQMPTLISILKSLKDNDFCKALEIIGSCTCEKEDWIILYKQLYDLNIFENIIFRSSSETRAIIQTILRAVSKISDWNSNTETRNIIMKSFESCLPCCRHEEKDIKSVFYQLFIQLATVQNDITVEATLCSALLMGLMDADEDISQTIRNFCSSNKILPKETLNRAYQILDILFPSAISLSIKTEVLSRSKFLSIATNLLLEMTSHSPDFIRPLFQNHLDKNIAFEPLTVTHMNSQTSRSLLPNFVKTNTNITVTSAFQEQTFKIPTSRNIPTKPVNFDWIKIASLSTQNEEIFENIFDIDNSMNLASTSLTESEVIGSFQYQSSYLSKSISENEMDINQGNKIFKQLTELTEQSEITSKRNADFFRYKAIEKQKSNEKKRIIERNLKKSAMFLYRNYHTGKLPYIQIENRSLIQPIQMLAQYNESFSKELFYHLYNSLIKEGSVILNQNLFKDHCSKMSQYFNNIFSTCTVYDKTLIGCCLQIAIENISVLSINPTIIYTASTLTGNQALATILLEKYLIFHLDETVSFIPEEPLIKKPKLADTSMITTIVPILMKLYNFLQLNEEMIGLLNNDVISVNISFIDKHIKALEADYLGNYAYSYKLYNLLLSEDQSLLNIKDESSFEFELLSVSENGLINSLEKLCKWNELAEFLDNLIKNSTHAHDQVVMKSLIHSKLRTSVLGMTNYSESMKELQNLITNFENQFPNSSELLIPMEMALYHIETGNYLKAQDVSEVAYKSVLMNYQKYSVSEETVVEMLQSLQLLHEMSEFISTVNNPNNLRILEKWNKTIIDTKYSLEFWEKLIFHRTVYLNKFKILLPSFSQKIEESLFNLQFQFIDACITQQRDVPALNNLRLCKSVSDQGSSDTKLMWNLKYSKVYLQSAACHGNYLLFDNIEEIVKGINNSISLLRKVPNIEETAFTLKWQYFTNLGDCYWTLANISQRYWSSISNDNLIRSLFKTANLEETETVEPLVSSLSKNSFNYFEKLISMFNEAHDQNDRQQLSRSLMVLSDFCDSQFVEENESDTYMLPNMIKSYAESTLYAMVFGEFSAKNKFPRVLQVLDKNGFNEINLESVIKIFSSIPSWMFIPWLDQMMPYLFSHNYSLVESIITRIVIEYPHALFYTFHLQVADVTDIQPQIARIKKQLSLLHLTNEFYTALLQMAQPEDRLENWLTETSVGYQDRNQVNHTSLVNQYKELYGTLFDDKESTSVDRMSSFQREFSDQFRHIMVQNFKEDGTNLYNLDAYKFSNIGKEIRTKLTQWKSKIRTHKTLTYFSPWLANYNIRENTSVSGDTNQNWLEVPGQYNNITSRPFPERNVKIFRFDSMIEIMKSKQCPKKIKIIGDNEQSYNFLLKSGEDLRQDYRIEQLFNVMNDILSGNCQLMRNTRSGKHLVTYKVIAVSKQIGLLEWIDNTVTLKAFYTKTMTPNEEQTYRTINQECYSKFPNSTSYVDSWSSSDFSDRNRTFEKHQLTIAKFDLLRRSFMIISKNHESFYRLRIKFIQQYATMSAAHYILGIGDRHLENFLVDESSGNIIGIDFGYSFGIGTIFLPIPELMPFRLTSSFMQFLKPAGVQGMFSQTLDTVLIALGQNQSTIISIMHVFMTNQIIDWHRLNKIAKQSIEGFTYKRINICHRKLRREDPLRLLYEELSLKHSKSKWLMKLQEFFIDYHSPSPTKQLVEMASNSAVLSRVWKGFEPFL